jgi:hypothetical protein
LLQEVVFDRHPSNDPGASNLYRVAQAGLRAWKIFPAELCRRVAMTVIDRAQSRLQQLPKSVLSTPLPDPGTALSYSLERRTINTLERTVMSDEIGGPWTLGRYVSLPRFGGRAVVDLLSAVEAHEGPLARRASLQTGRQLEQEVAFVVRNLPISEPRVQASTRENGVMESAKIDLSRLARSWVQRGHAVPFRLVAIGGVRIAVDPGQATAARSAYRTAARAVAFGGSASILEIATQLASAPGAPVDAAFIERLFSNLVTFRWVDRSAGVFWFAGTTTPFSASVRKSLLKARRRYRPRSSPSSAQAAMR